MEPDICEQDGFQELCSRMSFTKIPQTVHDILLYNTVDAWIEPRSSMRVLSQMHVERLLSHEQRIYQRTVVITRPIHLRSQLSCRHS